MYRPSPLNNYLSVGSESKRSICGVFIAEISRGFFVRLQWLYDNSATHLFSTQYIGSHAPYSFWNGCRHHIPRYPKGVTM